MFAISATLSRLLSVRSRCRLRWLDPLSESLGDTKRRGLVAATGGFEIVVGAPSQIA